MKALWSVSVFGLLPDPAAVPTQSNDELRNPADLELPEPKKAQPKLRDAIAKEIKSLTRDELDMDELSDRQAAAIRGIAEEKEKRGKDVVALPASAEDSESEGAETESTEGQYEGGGESEGAEGESEEEGRI